MERITFKKEKRETGLRAVGHPYPNTQIKVGGKVCGYIAAPSWQTQDVWRVRFSIIKANINEDGNPNCDWRWVTLAAKFDTEAAARAYVVSNLEHIVGKYKWVFRFES